MRLFSTRGYRLTILKLLYMYTSIELLHKQVVDGGSWLSRWEQKFTDKDREEARMIHVITGQTWRHQYELMFCLTDEYVWKYLQICVSTRVTRYPYISQFCQQRGPRSNVITVAMNTPSTQTLISNIVLQLKAPVLLGEMMNNKT